MCLYLKKKRKNILKNIFYYMYVSEKLKNSNLFEFWDKMCDIHK